MRALALALLCASCGSDLVPLDAVEIEAVSERDRRLRVFFRLLDDEECAGIRVRERDRGVYVTFVRASSSLPVDCAAGISDERTWAGLRYVDVDWPEHARGGDDMVEFFAEDGREIESLGGWSGPRDTEPGESSAAETTR